MNRLRAATASTPWLVSLLACVLFIIATLVHAHISPQQQLQPRQPIARPAAVTPLPSSFQDAKPLPQHVPHPSQPHVFGRQAESSTPSPATTTYSELPTAAITIDGQPPLTSASDPLLALMPDFAFSMPAQIVVDGINIALISVLLIHLLFTVQYHFPLSRKNFYLQISSSLMLLISLSVTLHIVLTQLESESQRYPFMFPYIGIQLPPGDDSWTKLQEVFFLLMRAITTALIHITHIQFLTLLFPSALEARLILWMLGPLAIINSGMEFTGLADDSDAKTNDLGDAIRNICNSTLTLLYTTALLIWGLLVNRRRAWRAGGGTAAFGGGSVGLALINTAISFTEIKYDRLWWLPNVCWTLTIWQSWLGFWWWVSSGMGIGEVEDRQERLERKRKREERKRRKLEKQKHKLSMLEAAELNNVEAHSSQHDSSSIPGFSGFRRRIKDRLVGEPNASGTLTRRHRRHTTSADAIEHDSASPSTNSGSAIDATDLNQIRVATHDQREVGQTRDASPHGAPLTEIAIHKPRDGGDQDADAANERDADAEADADAVNIDDGRTTAGTGSGSSDTNPTSSSAPGWISTAAQRFMDNQPNFIKARFRRLRLAHMAAARRAAYQQTALREQVLNSSRTTGPGLRHMMFDRPSSTRTGMNSSTDMNAAPELSSTLGRSASLGTKPTQDTETVSTASSLGATREPRSQSTDPEDLPQHRSSTNTRNSAALASLRQGRINEDEVDELEGEESPTLRATSQNRSPVRQTWRPTNLRSGSPASNRAASSLAQGAVVTEAGTTNMTARNRVSRPELASPSVTAGTRDDDWEDVETSAPVGRAETAASTQNPRRSTSRNPRDHDSDDEDAGDPSWFWRGGLRQMRLRDRTTYD